MPKVYVNSYHRLMMQHRYACEFKYMNCFTFHEGESWHTLHSNYLVKTKAMFVGFNI